MGPNFPKGTKRDILQLLRMGPASVTELCDELELSQTPVREHLYSLKSMDYVEESTKPDGPGRPKKLYRLTDRAEEIFPKSYPGLSSMLMELLREQYEESELRESLAELLKSRLDEEDDFMDALEDLGTYPTLESDDETGQELLIFHQCPFLDVAREDDILCDVDKVVLESLNQEVEVETTIARGGDQCVFRLGQPRKK